MLHSVDDDRVFNAVVADAYEELYARAYPSMDSSAESNDFRHLVSVPSLSDEGHNVFLVESGSQARLIYGADGDPSNVFDVFIERGEFQRVVRAAMTWRA